MLDKSCRMYTSVRNDRNLFKELYGIVKGNKEIIYFFFYEYLQCFALILKEKF